MSYNIWNKADKKLFKRILNISLRITFLFLCFLLPISAVAQETDTTRQQLDLDTGQRDIQLDRSMSGGMMSKMGTYNMPSEGQYYKRPFMGQKYLDQAVEAYRREIENQVGENWYWQFLKAVSPFIRLELGAFQGPQMEFIDPDHPLFESYRDDEKKQ